MTQVNPIFIASSVLIRQQTAVINSIRAHLAEFGIVRGSGGTVSSTCSMSLPIRATDACLSWRAHYGSQPLVPKRMP